MPENVTGFQPTGNLKTPLIDLAYFEMLPRRSPTFFREEPELIAALQKAGFDVIRQKGSHITLHLSLIHI